jgi:hypothetical protein
MSDTTFGTGRLKRGEGGGGGATVNETTANALHRPQTVVGITPARLKALEAIPAILNDVSWVVEDDDERQRLLEALDRLDALRA